MCWYELMIYNPILYYLNSEILCGLHCDEWPADWVTDIPPNCMTNRLTDWLTDRLTDQLPSNIDKTVYLTHNNGNVSFQATQFYWPSDKMYICKCGILNPMHAASLTVFYHSLGGTRSLILITKSSHSKLKGWNIYILLCPWCSVCIGVKRMLKCFIEWMSLLYKVYFCWWINCSALCNICLFWITSASFTCVNKGIRRLKIITEYSMYVHIEEKEKMKTIMFRKLSTPLYVFHFAWPTCCK